MSLKAGKRRTLDVSGSWLAGRLEAVISTLLNGWPIRQHFNTFLHRSEREHTNIEPLPSPPDHGFQALDECACCAFLLLNIAVPIVPPRTQNHLLRVCDHRVQQRGFAINVEIGRRGGACACRRRTCRCCRNLPESSGGREVAEVAYARRRGAREACECV